MDDGSLNVPPNPTRVELLVSLSDLLASGVPLANDAMTLAVSRHARLDHPHEAGKRENNSITCTLHLKRKWPIGKLFRDVPV